MTQVDELERIEIRINELSNRIIKLNDTYRELDITKREYILYKNGQNNKDQEKVFNSAKSIVDEIRKEYGSFTGHLSNIMNEISQLSKELSELYTKRRDILKEILLNGYNIDE